MAGPCNLSVLLPVDKRMVNPPLNARGNCYILKILGGTFLGGRRLKKGSVYKVSSGEEIL